MKRPLFAWVLTSRVLLAVLWEGVPSPSLPPAPRHPRPGRASAGSWQCRPSPSGSAAAACPGRCFLWSQLPWRTGCW